MVDPAVLIREGIFAAGIVALFLLVGLTVLVVRTASLPVCQKCGFRSVRRTHSHQSAADSFARACFLYPYRCEKCLRRFYCFGARRAHSGNMSMADASRSYWGTLEWRRTTRTQKSVESLWKSALLR